MNTSIASNVLEAIDNIEVVTQESDLDVCLSIYGQLIKQSVILEEYKGDEIEGFSIFQEGEILDPNILKYLSHIVSSNKGVNKAENQLTKAQIKHLAPEFMEDFNKGLNKWLAKNNMPLKSVSTSDIF